MLQRNVNLRTRSPSPPHSSAAFSKMESYCLEEWTESKESILRLHRLQVNHFSVIKQKLHMTNNLRSIVLNSVFSPLYGRRRYYESSDRLLNLQIKTQ